MPRSDRYVESQTHIQEIQTPSLLSMYTLCLFVEHGSSVVEWRTCNQESPGSNPPIATVSTFGHLPQLPSPLSCINEYLAIDGGGNMSDLVSVCNYCMARMVPREVELVSE